MSRVKVKRLVSSIPTKGFEFFPVVSISKTKIVFCLSLALTLAFLSVGLTSFVRSPPFGRSHSFQSFSLRSMDTFYNVMATIIDHLPHSEQMEIVDSVMTRMKTCSPFTLEDIESGSYTFVRVLGVDGVPKDFLVSSDKFYSAKLLAKKFVESRQWKIKEWDNGEMFLLFPGKYLERARWLFHWDMYL